MRLSLRGPDGRIGVGSGQGQVPDRDEVECLMANAVYKVRLGVCCDWRGWVNGVGDVARLDRVEPSRRRALRVAWRDDDWCLLIDCGEFTNELLNLGPDEGIPETRFGKGQV